MLSQGRVRNLESSQPPMTKPMMGARARMNGIVARSPACLHGLTFPGGFSVNLASARSKRGSRAPIRRPTVQMDSP